MHVIGRGQELPTVTRLLDELQPTNVELREWIPFDELPREIARATLCLGIFGTSEKAQRVIPNKLFQCLAVGRPVITADTPAIRRAFEPGEVATVPAGDASALAREILRLLDDDAARDAVAAAGHRRYLASFTSTHVMDALNEELHRTAIHQRRRGGA